MLHRRVDREHIVLMHLAEFRAEGGRGGNIADLPAGDVIGFAEAGNHEAARGQFRMATDGFMRDAVIHHMFIHLIRQQQDIAAAYDVCQRL
ncbi:hypothetical protein D3C81_1722200 [compost metagenome]